MTTMSDEAAESYDEFSMLEIYARHERIPWRGQPSVGRRLLRVDDEHSLSVLVWGSGEPQLVMLHGGGQNAHTWDSVALLLDRPLIAIDLPGHGHSDWRQDHDYRPRSNAKLLGTAIEQLAPRAGAVVGMSLGGLTNISLSAERPDLVRRSVIVDVTPGVTGRVMSMTTEQRGTTILISGPASYESFEAMLEATAAAAPHRAVESLAPGVLHNSRRDADGRWVWRYDRQRPDKASLVDDASLWEEVSRIQVPIMLVTGGRSTFVHGDDVREFLTRQPSARVEVVDGAGHSVQSDRPRALASLLEDFLAKTEPAGGCGGSLWNAR